MRLKVRTMEDLIRVASNQDQDPLNIQNIEALKFLRDQTYQDLAAYIR